MQPKKAPSLQDWPGVPTSKYRELSICPKPVLVYFGKSEFFLSPRAIFLEDLNRLRSARKMANAMMAADRRGVRRDSSRDTRPVAGNS